MSSPLGVVLPSETDAEEAGMASTAGSYGQRPVAGPGDVLAGRPTSLDRLDVLVGEWEMEATVEGGYFGPDSPAITGRGGRTTFEWLEAGSSSPSGSSQSTRPRPAAWRSSARHRSQRPSSSTTTIPVALPASTG